MHHRPVHHPAWHRIATLRPRLRSVITVTRQRFRNRRWYVIEDNAANQHFRLSDAAYAFIGLLDGERTAGEALRLCEQRMGDAAPTRAEAVRVLGQLFTANLIAADAPPDAEAVLSTHKRRRSRELRGKLASFLFFRIPLVDPNDFLDAIAPYARPIYSRLGLAAWIALITTAAIALAENLPQFRSQTAGVLAPANLPLLAAVFIATKLIHELGHGLACKASAHAEQPKDTARDDRPHRESRGEIHQLGIMLLVLFPVPYIDTSAAWSFRNKWRRILVNAAGMHAELAIAAAAALVFANTDPGSTANAVAHNAVFLAGVSTILFNANPLLRYDGYYILADITETPNLAARARDTLLSLVKRSAFGVDDDRDSAADATERWFLVSFAIASGIFRIAVAAFIVWFVSQQLFIVGVLLAAAAAAMLVARPVLKAVHYLATDRELEGKRPRAIAASLAAATAAAVALTAIPVPDNETLPGVVEPAQQTPVNAADTGIITRIAAHGRRLEAGQTVLRIVNPQLDAEIETLDARIDAQQIRARAALDRNDPANAETARQRLAALEDARAAAAARRDRLTVVADEPALWLSPNATDRLGTHANRDERLGRLVAPDARIVTAVARQTATEGLADTPRPPLIAPAGRPHRAIPAAGVTVASAATTSLPSPALAFNAGGPIRPDRDAGSEFAAEPFFPVTLTPAEAAGRTLFLGERVWVRFARPAKPIASQAARAIAQLLQKRNATR